MKNVSKMNGNEKIAWKNVKGIFGWNVGGWYNCLLDGYKEDIPATIEDAKEFIYEDAMDSAAGDGWYRGGRAPREMRFAGEAFIRECIDYLFETDGDALEIKEQVWDKADATEEKEEKHGPAEQGGDIEVCGGICWIGSQAMLFWAAM